MSDTASPPPAAVLPGYAPDPAFRRLYDTFTASPQSIGAHLNGWMADQAADAPLLVATGSDVVVFPGGGRPPLSTSFRNTTRGFVELTAVSHLGVAAAYLVQLHALGHPSWRTDAQALLAQLEPVQAVNTVAYWRDTVAVDAWLGWEGKIVDLVDYACDVTRDWLESFLADPEAWSHARLRDEYLDPVGSRDVPVPINDMMAATFALVVLDNSHRINRWIAGQEIDWERMMVVLCGRAGRPTAGLTWRSNSMCHLLWRASGERLQPERLYIAPHAPGLVLAELEDPVSAAAVESRFRTLWYSSRATVEMGRLMYEGYPAFHPHTTDAPVIEEGTTTLSTLPQVKGPDDRRAFMTLLRFVMEDPGQQLANASAHYVIDQLAATGDRPEAVAVPGFTGVDYPRRAPRR